MITPKIVAHRGYAARYPENTIEAFAAAIAAGVRHIELDVQLSSDQVPLIVHDANLKRTAGKDIDVLSTPSATLIAMKVGETERLGAEHANALLPPLAALVELLKKHSKVTAYVEIKDESLQRFGTRNVVERVLAVIKPVAKQCVIISYDLPCLEIARELSKSPIGWVLTRYDQTSWKQAQRAQPDFVICNYKKIDTPLWPGPWRWFLYEIATPALAREWATKGVEFLETMDVGALISDTLFASHD